MALQEIKKQCLFRCLIRISQNKKSALDEEFLKQGFKTIKSIFEELKSLGR